MEGELPAPGLLSPAWTILTPLGHDIYILCSPADSASSIPDASGLWPAKQAPVAQLAVVQELPLVGLCAAEGPLRCTAWPRSCTASPGLPLEVVWHGLGDGLLVRGVVAASGRRHGWGESGVARGWAGGVVVGICWQGRREEALHARVLQWGLQVQGARCLRRVVLS